MWFLLATVPWVILSVVALKLLLRSNSYLEEYDDEGIGLTEAVADSIITVAVYEDKAYWVHENIFYEADLLVEPDLDTARPLDTMSLSTAKVVELMEILDELEDHERD